MRARIPTPDIKVEGDYDPEQRLRSGRKLGVRGKAKVIEYILQGCSDRQINLLLVKDNVLEAGDSLSRPYLHKLRNLPEAQFDAAKLTAEATVVGLTAVSEIIVGQAEIWRQFYEKLMSEDDIPAAKLAAYATLLKNASETILGVFAPDLSERVREHIDRLRDQAKEAKVDRDYAKQNLAHVVSLVSRYLRGELDRDSAEAMLGEFAVSDQPEKANSTV